MSDESSNPSESPEDPTPSSDPDDPNHPPDPDDTREEVDAKVDGDQSVDETDPSRAADFDQSVDETDSSCATDGDQSVDEVEPTASGGRPVERERVEEREHAPADVASSPTSSGREYDGVLAAARRRAAYPETSRSVLGALVAIAVASLVMRVLWLGARVAHQDEGRVAYWILRYLESGVWEYRAIVHGPFLFHVNKWVFEFLGPSDFTSRLVVAVIGASLPLVAWLFRKHLRDTEVLALGLLLALNPVLVYYSRFMRNDVPLAFFMLAAVGFAVRYYDDRDYRYVFAAVGAFALGMTTKENGLLYAASWLGAAVLLLDLRLFVASRGHGDRGPVRTFAAYLDWLIPIEVRRIPTRVRRWLNLQQRADGAGGGTDASDDGRFWLSANWTAIAVIALAVVEFFAIIVFFYAPRGGGYLKPGGGGPPSSADDTTGPMGLYSSIGELGSGDPSMFVAVVEEATFGSWKEFTSVWGGHEHSYVTFAEHYLTVMFEGALIVSVFAVVGFLVDRYGRDGPRDLVALASYWGFVSVLGYPIATDIRAGWATTHAIVPLAIPAAVGIAILFRWGIESYTLEDGVGTVLAALLVAIAFGLTGMAVVDQVYQNPQDPDNPIIQYAQPSTDTKPTLARVERLGRERGGPDDVDALFWGDEFAVTDESEMKQPPAPSGYYGRRTWMWYMEMYQYRANQSGEHFVYGDTDDPSVLEESKPPVVIALGQSERPRVPKDGGEELHEWLVDNGYERVSHQRYGDSPDEERSRPILFYLRVNPEESTDGGPFDGGRADPLPTPGSVENASAASDGWVASSTTPGDGWVTGSTTTGDGSTLGAPPGAAAIDGWNAFALPRTGSEALNASTEYLPGNEQRGALCRRTAIDGARLQRGTVA